MSKNIQTDAYLQFAEFLCEKISKVDFKNTPTVAFKMPSGNNPECERTSLDDLATEKGAGNEALAYVLGEVFVENDKALKNNEYYVDANGKYLGFVKQPPEGAELLTKNISIVLKGPEAFYDISKATDKAQERFEQDKKILLDKILTQYRFSKKRAHENAKFNINIAGHGVAGQYAQYLMSALSKELCKKEYDDLRSSLSSINCLLEDSTKVNQTSKDALQKNLKQLKKISPNLKIRARNIIHSTLSQNYLLGVNGFVDVDEEVVESTSLILDGNPGLFFDDKQKDKRVHHYYTNEDAEGKKEQKFWMTLNDNFISTSVYRQLHKIRVAAKKFASKFFDLLVMPFSLMKKISSFAVSKIFPTKYIEPKTKDWVDDLDRLAKIETEHFQETADAPPIVNIVFEGGGAKGLSHAGVYKELEVNGQLQNLERVAGSSAGGLMSLMVALGFSADEIIEKSYQLDFTNLKEINSLATIQGVKALATLAFEKGLNDGEKLHRQLEQFIQDRFDKVREENPEAYQYITENICNNFKKITFGQLHEVKQKFPELGIKDLFVTSTNLSRRTQDVFSYLEREDFPVAYACKLTALFPGAFKPETIKEADGTESKYLDGGITGNLPMKIFDDDVFMPEGYTLTKQGTNPCTVGVLVDSKKEIDKLWRRKGAIKPPTGYELIIMEIFNSLRNQYDAYQKYPGRIIQALDSGISTLEFKLSDHRKDLLVQGGRRSTREYLKNYRGKFEVSKIDFAKSCEALPMDYLDDLKVEFSNQIQELKTVLTSSQDRVLDTKSELGKEATEIIQESNAMGNKVLEKLTEQLKIIEAELSRKIQATRHESLENPDLMSQLQSKLNQQTSEKSVELSKVVQPNQVKPPIKVEPKPFIDDIVNPDIARELQTPPPVEEMSLIQKMKLTKLMQNSEKLLTDYVGFRVVTQDIPELKDESTAPAIRVTVPSYSTKEYSSIAIDNSADIMDIERKLKKLEDRVVERKILPSAKEASLEVTVESLNQKYLISPIQDNGGVEYSVKTKANGKIDPLLVQKALEDAIRVATSETTFNLNNSPPELKSFIYSTLSNAIKKSPLDPKPIIEGFKPSSHISQGPTVG